MTIGFSQIAVILFIFLALLCALLWAMEKKLKDFFSLVLSGTKLEFTTPPGLVSLVTVIIIAAIVALFITVHEIKTLLYALFNIQSSEQGNVLVGIFAVILAMMLDFIFIAVMRHYDSKTSTKPE